MDVHVPIPAATIQSLPARLHRLPDRAVLTGQEDLEGQDDRSGVMAAIDNLASQSRFWRE
jgi:hypothetical protein